MSATVQGKSAKWMSFYDQAFKVEMDDGTRLLTNFRYSVKDSVEANPLQSGAKSLSQLDTDDYDKFDSQCDRTMVGFVQRKGSGTMANHPIQCFYAVKSGADGENGKQTSKKPQSEEKKETKKQAAEETEDEPVALAQTSTKSKVRKGKKGFRSNEFADHTPSEATDLEITEHNSSNQSWTANTCMLSKSHPDHGGKKCSKPLNLAQTSSKLDTSSQSYLKALATAQSWSQLYSSADEIPDDKLPESYDFRNLDGHDLTGPVRDQEHCGSCHTLSFL